MQPNEPGFFVLSDPASAEPDDRDIVFVRASGLSDPGAPHINAADQTGWPLDDIEGWLDNLAEGITITNRQNVNLGDRSAVLIDLRVEDDFECGASSVWVSWPTACPAARCSTRGSTSGSTGSTKGTGPSL